MQIETAISLVSLVVCIGCYINTRRMRVSLEKALNGNVSVVQTRTSSVRMAEGTTREVETKVTHSR